MKYNYNRADKYWSERAKTKEPLQAVLHVGLPEYANKAFDFWFHSHLSKFVEKDMKILDVGCGVGRVLIPLAKKGHQVSGVDISKQMIDITRREVKEKGLQEKVDTSVSSADRLPYPDKNFDMVVLAEILFHIPDSLLADVISESIRVLKKGGLVIVTANNLDSIFLKGVVMYSEQREDGYFFTVRNLNDVDAEFKKNKMKLIYRRGLPLITVLNNLKNGKSKFAKIYKKWMFDHQNLFKPLYKVSALIDSNINTKKLDENLTGIFFLVFEK